jgi:hypothetical protein
MAPKNWAVPVDFFARRSNYVDHLAPIWFALDESLRGSFYVPAIIADHAIRKGIEVTVLHPPGINNKLDVAPAGKGPLVTCAYGDLQIAERRNPHRAQIFMQHGVGLSFPHNGYAGGTGMQREVSLFLDPNQHTRDMVARVFPHKPGYVIGTPKLDSYITTKTPPPAPPQMGTFGEGRKPVVCISFHWDGSAIAPEAGNAFAHFRHSLHELGQQEQITVIGHGHPRMMGVLDPFYRSCGIEPVWEFDEVMERADLYVNDCSSTMYEFLVTGKPVVIMNAPQFRRGVNLGLRFWEYTDIGPQVDEPGDLLAAISGQLSAVRDGQDPYTEARKRAVRDLYPYLGQAAQRAADVIEKFINTKRPGPAKVEQVDGESIGMLYMCFGPAAASEIRKSIMSLRNVGLNIPVAVVGDTPVKGTQFIEWTGESPFDPGQRENFQFRAGRIKPHLVGLTPFQRTLYIDADTEFMSDILAGFKFLGDHDMALAEELLSIGQLYNKPRAGWEINIKERDATIEELGGDPNTKFLNSGVIFFRKCEAVERLFAEWSLQWLKWQQWDEQLALMRAMHKYPINFKALSVHWNHPHRNQAKVIFHNYGRGTARVNVAEPGGLYVQN